MKTSSQGSKDIPTGAVNIFECISRVLEEEELTHLDKNVFMALITFNGRGSIYPSREAICRRIGTMRKPTILKVYNVSKSPKFRIKTIRTILYFSKHMRLVKDFAFASLSIIIAVLTLITYPANYKGKTANALLKFWTNAVLFIYGIKINVYGKENVESGKGKIYISNHSSYLDIFVLLAKIPDNIRMIYKKEINKIPLIGWAMLAAEFVPLNRKNVRMAMKSLDKAAGKIKKGISFVIFPEGTRSENGQVKDFKKGLFILAEKSKADIIPVSISNTFNLMPRGTLKIKSGCVNLVLGKPMKFKKEPEFLKEIREKVISNLKPISINN